MAIYIEIDVVPETIKEFFEYFYGTLPKKNSALYGLTTFFDKELKKEQCNCNTYRSFDDLLELAKTYYEEANEINVMKALLDLDIFNTANHSYTKPHLGYCRSMNRIRYVPYYDINDADHLSVRMDQSKYTWIELLKNLNINNNEELITYIKNRKLINK